MNPKDFVNKLDSLSWHFLLGIIIILFGFLIYSNSFNGALVMDDANVVKPEITRVLDHPETYFKFTQQRLIADITFALNYRIHETEVFGYHLVNFTVHIVNTFAVLVLVSLIMETPVARQLELYKRKRFVVATAALIFLTHPIQTMAVSYITQRYASMATFFFILSVLFFIWGRNLFIQLQTDKNVDSRLVKIAVLCLWVVSGVMFLLGMHTKAIVGTVPLVIFGVEWLLYRQGKFPWKWLVPLGLVAIGIFYLGTQLHTLNFMFFFRKPNAIDEVITPFNYLPTQFRVMVMYLVKIAVPIRLNADYYFPVSHSFLEIGVIFGIAVWSSIVSLIWYLRKNQPLISLGLFWFIVTPLITSSIIPILDVINEYRMYLPMVGVSLLFSVVIWQWGPKVHAWATAIGVVSLILVYGVLTFNRNFVYQTASSYWGDVIKKSPDKPRGYVNYAVEMHTNGNAQAALENYLKALELDPDRLTALANVGVLYTQTGKFDTATEYFEKALSVDPDYVDALNGMGVVAMNKGEFVKAQEYFERVLVLEPDRQSAINNLELLGQKKEMGSQ